MTLAVKFALPKIEGPLKLNHKILPKIEGSLKLYHKIESRIIKSYKLLKYKMPNSNIATRYYITIFFNYFIIIQ